MNAVIATLALVCSFLFAPTVFATGIDYSSLTSAIDVAGVATALLAAAALMITVVVARWGIKKVLSFF